MNTRLLIASLATIIGLSFSVAACADDDANGIEDEARLVRAATVSLVDGVTAAEQNQNGKAFEASIDDTRNGVIYEVSVAVGEQVFEVDVDTNSGDVTNAREDRDDNPVVLGSPLNAIIQTAEQHQNGTAYEVDCDREGDVVQCEVDVITDADESYEVVIDGTSGEVVSSTLDTDD